MKKLIVIALMMTPCPIGCGQMRASFRLNRPSDNYAAGCPSGSSGLKK